MTQLPGGVKPGHWLIFILLGVATFLMVAVVRYPETLLGAQVDADGYMRLIRIYELLESGQWFDNRVERSNWPWGDVLHWTRPLDVLILALALPLVPFLELRSAIHVAGSGISPLLFLASGLALIWAVQPMISRRVRALVAPALLVQPVAFSYAVIGRADHHVLILFLFVVGLGALLRWVMDPTRTGAALAVGLISALGIWVSPEFLVPLAVAFLAGALVWVYEGRGAVEIGRDAVEFGRGAAEAGGEPAQTGQGGEVGRGTKPGRGTAGAVRGNLALSAGLAGGLAVALVLERPPADWLTVAYDRISVAHLTMALVAVGFWGVLRWAGRMGGRPVRWAVVGGGGLAAAALLHLIHPDFFRGPWISVAPEVNEVWLRHVRELQPTWPQVWSGTEVARLISTLGAAALVLPFMGWRALRAAPGADHTAQRAGWLLLAGTTLLFVVMTWAQLRWGLYVGALLAIGVVAILDQARLTLERRAGEGDTGGSRRAGRELQVAGPEPPGLPLPDRLLHMALVVLLVPGFLVVGAGVGTAMEAFGEAAEAAPTVDTHPVDGVVRDAGEEERCDLRPLAPFLRELEDAAGGPVTILTHLDRGPEILFRTPHRVLAGPYHRNREGILDIIRVFNSPDGPEVRRVLTARDVRLILTCPEGDEGFLGRGGDRSIFWRLVADDPPSWARPVALPDSVGHGFLLYEVTEPSGGP